MDSELESHENDVIRAWVLVLKICDNIMGPKADLPQRRIKRCIRAKKG